MRATRFTLVGLSFLAMVIAYTDRVNISVAAIQLLFGTAKEVIRQRLQDTGWNHETSCRGCCRHCEEQQISVEDALKAITINGAYQYFEEDSKGSLEAGKLADLVVLSDNPLDADPLTIKDIQVIETIKEGATVYMRNQCFEYACLNQ